MRDLISRQAAIDAVHKDYDAILDFKSDGHTVADSFEDIINALPSAQPEIIRCKDCKYYGTQECLTENAFCLGGSDYCSWAELRGDSE